jgi:hypothetical protein
VPPESTTSASPLFSVMPLLVCPEDTVYVVIVSLPSFKRGRGNGTICFVVPFAVFCLSKTQMSYWLRIIWLAKSVASAGDSELSHKCYQRPNIATCGAMVGATISDRFPCAAPHLRAARQDIILDELF